MNKFNISKKFFSTVIASFILSLSLFFTAEASSIHYSYESEHLYHDRISENQALKNDFPLQNSLFNSNRLPFCDRSIKTNINDNNTYVVPMGDSIGIRLFTDGLLVLSTAQITDINQNITSPAFNAGIRENDRIIAINGEKIENVEKFNEYITNNSDKITLTIARDNDIFDVDVIPVSDSLGIKRIGLWVRDSTAGIGTMTFYDPKTMKYAALGHPITDPDTGDILKIREGDLLNCDILSVKKGEYGIPGELTGSLSGVPKGNITKNNNYGIFGVLKNPPDNSPLPIKTASRFQVKEGDAKILSDVDGNGVKEYSVKISDVSKSPECTNKGISIEITDEELLNKTGGIVQGMSGSPIIQNDMLVGAITYVLVNNPTKGYGIFIENMIDEVNQHQ